MHVLGLLLMHERLLKHGCLLLHSHGLVVVVLGEGAGDTKAKHGTRRASVFIA